MGVKIVSWNIWKSKQIDDVISQLIDLNPDVACLQEVIESEENNAGAEIAKALSYHHAYCKAFYAERKEPPYTIGNSIISRYPLTNTSCNLLSTLQEYDETAVTEPRALQLATIQIEDKELTIGNTHLGYSPHLIATSSQRTQLQKLLTLVSGKKIILSGDFNSLPQSEIILEIDKVLTNTDPNNVTATRITRRDEEVERHRIDYIFASRDIKFRNFVIHSTIASDHTPLSVEIDL